MLNICILIIEVSNNKSKLTIIRGREKERLWKRERRRKEQGDKKRTYFIIGIKVRGIINTILRTPGCFLSPKNVLPFNGGVCREMWKKVHIYIYISAQKITFFYKQYKIHWFSSVVLFAITSIDIPHVLEYRTRRSSCSMTYRCSSSSCSSARTGQSNIDGRNRFWFAVRTGRRAGEGAANCSKGACPAGATGLGTRGLMDGATAITLPLG
jgi:hypothetical protein